jgi:hypothetical protein
MLGGVRDRCISSFETYRPNGKRYDDSINRLRWGLDSLLTSAREAVVIGVCQFKGYI